MKKSQTWIAIFVFAALALSAAAPAGFEIWPSTQLKAFTKSLAPKMSAQKVATQQLGKWGNHSFMVAHREGNGEAELHETQADVFFVQTGEGTLKVGGTVVDPKTTAANEVRGPSIQGGEEKKLSAGDVVHIPAKVPHQLLVANGKQITYAVVKVTE
jgi:mannose-6-phosphate isomerase-like protein (cupin superfamily)